MRSKELAHDYRYFPDPDLPPLAFSASDTARLASELGTLPHERLERYLEMGLSQAQSQQLLDGSGLADYADAAIAASGKPQATINFVLGDLSRLANEAGTAVASSRVTPAALAELVALVEAGTINSKIAKDVLARASTGGGSPREIVERDGLGQVSDAAALDAIVADVLAANVPTVAEYRAGKTKVMGFLVGRVMKESRGKANPQLAEARLRVALDAC